MAVYFLQDIIQALNQFWSNQGCLLANPYDVETGAGTMNPATCLAAIGPEPWKVAYVEPSRRPVDGRYGKNPNRLYKHHQYQVLLKPSPQDSQQLYLQSLRCLGISAEDHDIRFVEDNWEAPTLGAWGVGWEVWLDGMEVTQYTYFQQVGGLECQPVSVELTYGLERIALYLQNKENVFDLEVVQGVSYEAVFKQQEFEHSKYTFDICQPEQLFDRFIAYEQEAKQCLDAEVVVPAYDYILKCSHTFNLLDAAGAISVSERAAYISRIRKLTQRAAKLYFDERQRLGFPLSQNIA